MCENLKLLDTIPEFAILVGGRESLPAGDCFSDSAINIRENAVRKSVLEAIRQGEWDFEPEKVQENNYESTVAMPGTDEKLSVMAARVEAGLPLWHGSDRTEYDDES